MQLTEHRPERELFVRQANANTVTIVDRVFTHSLVLSVERVIEDFPPRCVAELDASAIARIFELQPEVVLLGTGERAVFPPQSVLGQFLTRGVGLESMDSSAAARTFNVLAGEGRRVAAVFLMNP